MFGHSTVLEKKRSIKHRRQAGVALLLSNTSFWKLPSRHCSVEYEKYYGVHVSVSVFTIMYIRGSQIGCGRRWNLETHDVMINWFAQSDSEWIYSHTD